jgi:hypothetical protein
MRWVAVAVLVASLVAGAASVATATARGVGAEGIEEVVIVHEGYKRMQ